MRIAERIVIYGALIALLIPVVILDISKEDKIRYNEYLTFWDGNVADFSRLDTFRFGNKNKTFTMGTEDFGHVLYFINDLMDELKLESNQAHVLTFFLKDVYENYSACKNCYHYFPKDKMSKDKLCPECSEKKIDNPL